MKIELKHLIVILFVLVLGLNGCAASATPLPLTQTAQPQATPTVNPKAALVLDMAARINAGDAEGSLAYFAEDAMIYFIGMPPTGIEIYRGVEQLRPIWEDCVNNHFKWEVEIVSTVGDVVTARTKTWHDFTIQLGVAPNEFIDVFLVQDGKITTYGSTITEGALAKFRPALAAVMPPAPTPTPSSESPVSEVTVTYADDTCTYSGPLLLKAGEIKVNWEVKDQNREGYALTFFTLDEGKDMVDLMAATVSSQPSWSSNIFYKQLGPGESQTYTFSVKPGMVYMVCWSKPPELAIGNVGPFEVVP
jgi:ketosteroid isomerase-like protein